MKKVMHLLPIQHQFLFQLNQLFYTMIVIQRSLRRRQTEILDIGESTQDVGEQTVGETIRRRNDPKAKRPLFRKRIENSMENMDTDFRV